MKRILSILVVVLLVLTGCITKNPQNLTPIPPNPEMEVLKRELMARQLPPMPSMPKMRAMRATAPLAAGAPAGAFFYDPFNTGANTPWTFYRGTRLFNNSTLKLTATNKSGAYAYIRTNWVNISVQADVALDAGSWGAGVGGRYNPTNGANYQVWMYQSGRLAIEKYSNWFNTWTAVAQTTIPSPGTNYQNLRLSISNDVLVAYYNGTNMLTYTDPTPWTSGGICLSIWSSSGKTVDNFDNVLVYDPSKPIVSNTAPRITSGLTNQVGLQGSNITFTVAATGIPTTYYWKLPGGAIKTGTNTYTLTNAQYANKGTYTAIVSNNLGVAQSAAYLAVGTTNILTNCVTYKPANVTLAWCPSPDSNVIGYNIYYGSGITPTNWTPAVFVVTNPPCDGYYINRGSNFFRAYTNTVAFGNVLTGVVSNLNRGSTYFFTATAYDSWGLESDFSEELKYTVPSTNYPFNFSVIIAKLNNKTVLQAKVCPDSLMNVYFSTNLASTNWSQIATNAPPDSYGNFIYTHEVPSAWQGYYRVERK